MDAGAVYGNARARQYRQPEPVTSTGSPGPMDVVRSDADFGSRRGVGKLMEVLQVLGRALDRTSRRADPRGEAAVRSFRCVHDIVEAAAEPIPAVTAAETGFDYDLLPVRIEPGQRFCYFHPHFALPEGEPGGCASGTSCSSSGGASHLTERHERQ